MAKNASSKQVAFLFGEGGTSRDKLGGKGAGLAESIELGLPVPMGFTLTTSVARAFAQHNAVPNRLRHQITWGFAAMEKASGKRFGDAANPLLVSVRSGAKFSMPGMMDTVLNLGINPEIAAGLAAQTDKLFAYDCYRRFLSMFGEVVQGIHKDVFKSILADIKARRGVVKDQELSGDDWQQVCELFRAAIVEHGKALIDDPQVQLTMAIDAVLTSWNTPRAREYRAAKGIPNDLGTAVNIQTMVYGNRDDDSATGVAFSRNTATGALGLTVEFLVRAQGEDVVAGVRTPAPLSVMASWNKQAAQQLEAIVLMLEEHYGYVVDVEFTVESGVLFILQVRRAKLAPLAAVTTAVHAVWAKQSTKEEAVASVTSEQLASVLAPAFAEAGLKAATAIANGLVACPGAIVGRVVLTCEEAIAASKRGETVVLVREDTSPDDLPGMLVAAAIVTKTGGQTCHAAVVARDLSKPCIVGCGEAVDSLVAGMVISVNANEGGVYRGSLTLVEPVKTKEVNLFAKWHGIEESKKIPAPRLVFEYVSQSVQVSRILNDFYLADSMAAAARGTSLASEANSVRTKVHVEVAERLAMYLTVAVGGELRHAKPYWMQEGQGGYSGYGGYSNPGRALPSLHSGDANLKALVDEYHVKLDGIDRADAQVEHTNRLKAMSHVQHVRFLDLCAKVFNNGRWQGSMGGRPWGQIAQAAHDFLAGTMSHTRFADHAFDLQHNNGTVFGKNPMLSGNRSDIQARLDRKKHANGTVDLYQTLGGTRRQPRMGFGSSWSDAGGYGQGYQGYNDGPFKTDGYKPSMVVQGFGVGAGAAVASGEFSPEVEALYQKGLRANLWK
jgi:Phosphoenolpyruvate synthase/pyruvate phosphate dikinase